MLSALTGLIGELSPAIARISCLSMDIRNWHWSPVAPMIRNRYLLPTRTLKTSGGV